MSEAPLMSEGAAAGAGFAPRPRDIITRAMGRGLSIADSISALRAIDTDTPSLTVRSASFLFAGVIRLIAPI